MRSAAGTTAQDDETGLAAALTAEHAAIYAYGPIGAQLHDEEAEAARAAERSHRARRDGLLLTLTERGVEVPATEAAYELPFPLTGEDDARQLAILVEERVAAVWRAVLPQVAAGDRATALDALVDAAVRAASWRVAAGVEPATTAFPGAP